MANDAFTQVALANDPRFRVRLKAALLAIAAQVLGEDPATANHPNRVVYANKVIAGPDTEAAKAAPFLVMRPNVNNFVTSYTYDFTQGVGSVVNACGDADLQSQIATDWNWLAAA